MSQSRRLAAILAADIAGYSALMGSDEARTVNDLKGHQAVVLPMVGDFGGRVIDTADDPAAAAPRAARGNHVVDADGYRGRQRRHGGARAVDSL